MELRNGDLMGIPPSGGLAKLVCKIVQARTFHWLMIIGRDKDGWITSESLGKGTSVSRFVYPTAYIYRIKSLKHEPETYRLISFHSQRGEAVYDFQANFLAGIWFLLKHYLKIAIPIVKNNTYNCQEWVIYLAYCLKAKIIPDSEYPYCRNLEKSEYLEYLGELRQSQ